MVLRHARHGKIEKPISRSSVFSVYERVVVMHRADGKVAIMNIESKAKPSLTKIEAISRE